MLCAATRTGGPRCTRAGLDRECDLTVRVVLRESGDACCLHGIVGVGSERQAQRRPINRRDRLSLVIRRVPLWLGSAYGTSRDRFATCWCTRLIVESIDSCQSIWPALSAQTSNACRTRSQVPDSELGNWQQGLDLLRSFAVAL